MKSFTTKVLVGVLSVLLFATIGSQVYYHIHDKHDTEEAVLCTINEDIRFQGLIVRDEKVINQTNDGVLDYLYDDGSKVSAGSTIANVYSKADDIIARKKVDRINKTIASLNRAQNPGTTDYVQPDTLKTKIDNEYKQILTDSLNKDYSSLNNVKDDLSVVINIYSLITGNTKNFNSQIQDLSKESKALTDTSKPINSIVSEQTGYFVSYADGYEDSLNMKTAASLSEDKINEILNKKIEHKSNVVGKILSDYKCKIVGVLKEDSRISEGASLKMMLDSSNMVYDINVESVRPANEDGKVIAVFTCDRLDDALVESRVQNIKLTFDEYKGIKVPRKAIRFQGEQKGVYVILGKDITFKKIDVIYENEDDDFVISKNTSDDKCLLLYDQILLEVVFDKDVSESK